MEPGSLGGRRVFTRKSWEKETPQEKDSGILCGAAESGSGEGGPVVVRVTRGHTSMLLLLCW